MTEELDSLPPVMDRIQRSALIVGAVGLALCAVGFFVRRDEFYKAYLYAYLFWIGLPLGCLAILMLQHLTGGVWGLVIRRPLEAGTRMLPWMILFYLPLMLGHADLYRIAGHGGEVEPNAAFRDAYLSPGFFYLRVGIYFAIWLGLGFLLNKWSVQQDREADQSPALLLRRFRLVSGPGLVLYGLTVTLVAVDWVMSLDPHWYSTIYGMMFMVGQCLSALAFIIVVLSLLSRSRPMAELVRLEQFHDLGNLLLAFTMLWAYIGFSQYLIIWSGI